MNGALATQTLKEMNAYVIKDFFERVHSFSIYYPLSLFFPILILNYLTYYSHFEEGYYLI